MHLHSDRQQTVLVPVPFDVKAYTFSVFSKFIIMSIYHYSKHILQWWYMILLCDVQNHISVDKWSFVYVLGKLNYLQLTECFFGEMSKFPTYRMNDERCHFTFPFAFALTNSPNHHIRVKHIKYSLNFIPIHSDERKCFRQQKKRNSFNLEWTLILIKSNLVLNLECE